MTLTAGRPEFFFNRGSWFVSRLSGVWMVRGGGMLILVIVFCGALRL
jgi:hypothetical protein